MDDIPGGGPSEKRLRPRKCWFQRQRTEVRQQRTKLPQSGWGIRKYMPYLEDHLFLMRSKNKSLTLLQSAKDGKTKLTNWTLEHQQCELDLCNIIRVLEPGAEGTRRDPRRHQHRKTVAIRAKHGQTRTNAQEPGAEEALPLQLPDQPDRE
jgi:hypothetical protein